MLSCVRLVINPLGIRLVTEMGEISVVVPGFAGTPRAVIPSSFSMPFQVACQASFRAVASHPFPVLIGFRFLGFCEVLPDAQAAVDSLP